jgi:hypothetical protein
VDGNLAVRSGAVLVLGCELEASTRFDNESLTTHDWIGGNLDAVGALTVIAHSNTIDHNLTLAGGGGGCDCDPQALVFGLPAYATFEDNTINGTYPGESRCTTPYP